MIESANRHVYRFCWRTFYKNKWSWAESDEEAHSLNQTLRLATLNTCKSLYVTIAYIQNATSTHIYKWMYVFLCL